MWRHFRKGVQNIVTKYDKRVREVNFTLKSRGVLYGRPVTLLCFTDKEQSKLTSSPWAVTLSWQRMTSKRSKLGQTDLIFGL